MKEELPQFCIYKQVKDILKETLKWSGLQYSGTFGEITGWWNQDIVYLHISVSRKTVSTRYKKYANLAKKLTLALEEATKQEWTLIHDYPINS